jgi:DNA-binding SARP family transcriptional activator
LPRARWKRCRSVYLACTGGSHARGVLAERFWAERASGRALGNLQVALTSLRKEVGDYLLIGRNAVSIQPGGSVWLDAAQLEEQLHAGQLEAAVGLYRGEFVSGFYARGCPGFEDWLTLERERLRRLVLDALHDLVDHHLEVGDYRAGIAQAARMLELDPLLEEAHRQLMRLLAYDGHRGAALAQYEACRCVLQDELGVEPDEEMARLFEQIQAGELERPATSAQPGSPGSGGLAVSARPGSPGQGDFLLFQQV